MVQNVYHCIVVYKILKILQRIHQKELHKKNTVFNMKKSNVHFFSLQKGTIVVNRKIIEFNSEKCEIPVLVENRELLCIGNVSNKTTKIQISSKLGGNAYFLRTEPEIITLKKNFACEFSVYLTPLYSTTISSDVMIISKSLSNNKQSTYDFIINAKTEMNSRLDPTEISIDKKIGEGSFGLVYQGTFRNNLVAIKQMKESINEAEKMKDFEREVCMLDKFRSKIIVHFYGAVFIPSKNCMVTEFAQFSSLNDLMIKMKWHQITEKLKIKFIIDAAKGLSYLHTNGILQRDIKPDNILIVSVERNDQVNAKLTDFGASRNINMLMTNMTFTKEVGTPNFMAPEVLKGEKYTTSADVYSFAITIYECFGWCEAYSKDAFKFPWKIAEFVTARKRLEKRKNIIEELTRLMEQCWLQNSDERIKINHVVDELQLIRSTR
ncbi:serine/threonine protein kinase HT1, putative [Entamoeba invadens IP1]|uniref:Serine/threonine protein kinase HT1, putative n=1 Tax=Entamoeba invadens IP1 TaxID=370355 RepID=L7FPE3_ENTIV|nr:serine/threonine protein kinase HT1, putative [Entamoeba invadens IP1]ELP94704.1 serine/threonine protein kinase HT1, putative [Entamoeba invadens IP1]|eukprot:XP_004261475.1 serine/threonine protein kinase HT1, putative [Entamoeba invadens IP1]